MGDDKKGSFGAGGKTKKLRLGDWVAEKKDKKRRGRIIGGSDNSWTVDIGEDEPITGISNDSLRRTNTTYQDLGGNFGEVALNSIAFSAMEGIFRKQPFFSHRVRNFLVSDAVYEVLLRGMAEGMIPQLRPDQLSKEDAESFFSSKDLVNGVGKAIPVVVLMAIANGLMKKGFSHHMGRNIVDAAVAMSLSNIVGRKFSDTDKGYNY